MASDKPLQAHKKFTRVKEDFTCGHCGASVKGSGYTNHCPRCLWSKHVDVNPGDRAAECGGLMEPVSIAVVKDGYDILHKCVKYGYEKINKYAAGDDYETILRLSVGK